MRRELTEELGIRVMLLGLLETDRLRPRDDELSEAAFVTAAEAIDRLRDRIRRRFEHALKALDEGRPLYLRDGAPLM